MKYKRLGDLLLAAGMITESDLEEALKIQKSEKTDWARCSSTKAI